MVGGGDAARPARGALSLGVFRFLLGMGEAGNWPAAVKVVAEWFPERERALASGIFNSGSAVGAILAPPLVAWLLLHFGWQAAFLFVGSRDSLWLLAWWFLYHTPAACRRKSPPPPVPPRNSSARASCWQFTLSKIFLDPVWYFYIFWFPQYLKSARGFDLAAIGKFAWIPFLVAGFGNIWAAGVGPPAPARLFHHRRAQGFGDVLRGFDASAIPAVLAPERGSRLRSSPWRCSATRAGWPTCSPSRPTCFPKNAVGSVYGLASMGSGFGGMVFTLITGWVVDHYSYTPVFFGFGVLPLICASILWLFAGELRMQAKSSPRCRACHC